MPTTLVRAAARQLATTRGQHRVSVWLIVLLMSGQGFRYLLGMPGYLLITVITVVATAVAFRSQWRNAKPPLLVGAFVGLAALSVLWSATRMVTLLAVLALAVTTYLAIVTARGSTGSDFMFRLYRGLQVSLAMGLVFEVIVAALFLGDVSPVMNDLANIAGDDAGLKPQLWTDGLLFQGGPIQGFVGNRNPFGAIALFLVVVTFILMLERRIGRIEGWVTIGASIFVHLLTQSATVSAAAIYLIAIAAGAIAIRRAPVRYKRVLSFGVLAMSAAAAVLTLKYRVEIFALLGRDADLTNRTEIWDDVLEFAQERPDGWGFVGYWPIWAHPYSEMGTEVKWVRPTHAHNAFLDAWLQVGLIGLVLLVVMVVLLFGSTWRLVERAGKGDTYLPLGWVLLTVALTLQALTESRLLVEGGWFLLVALYCAGPPVFRLTIVDPELVRSGLRRTDRHLAGGVTVFSGVDHVMLAMPRAGEERARAFYTGVLGMVEMECPPPMRAQGGCCFETGDVVLHLGATDDFAPATMAHPAIIVEDLDALQFAVENHGYTCVRSESAHPGIERFHTHDTFGNRIEFQQA